MSRPSRGAVIVATLLMLVSSVVAAQSPWSASYAREAEGDFAGAIAALEPVLIAEPEHEFALLRRGWLRYLNAEYNEAIRDYRRAQQLNPDSLEATLGLTLPLLAQRRWREAAASAEQVIAVSPWNYYAQIRLMTAEEGLQRWQSLAERAAAAAERFPSDATIQVYLARAQSALGNRAAAAQAYERVLERLPEHAEALDYLGTAGP